jgi:hypothetical protein
LFAFGGANKRKLFATSDNLIFENYLPTTVAPKYDHEKFFFKKAKNHRFVSRKRCIVNHLYVPNSLGTGLGQAWDKSGTNLLDKKFDHLAMSGV